MSDHVTTSSAPRLTEPLLRGREVAELLGVSTRSVERLAAAGHLRRVQIRGSVRFRAADVRALISRGAAL